MIMFAAGRSISSSSRSNRNREDDTTDDAASDDLTQLVIGHIIKQMRENQRERKNNSVVN